MSSKLAINGGEKIRTTYFPSQYSFGKEYEEVVKKVLENKILSGYRGNYIENFWGGEECKKIEKKFSIYFDSKALAFNSCTSALQLACGAIGIQPGDEVIVTPWSMCCSATAPMIWGGVPVFADIDRNNFCLDPASVESKITKKTKAIIAVDLFGNICDFKNLRKLADKYGLYIIEDAAQAIGSIRYDEQERRFKKAGTYGDIGCFSFTQGKHLTSGEGGIALLQEDNIGKDVFMKMALLRNHAESVISSMQNVAMQQKFAWELNMVGFNMRMTELQATILGVQLNELLFTVKNRQQNASYISEKLTENIPAIKKSKQDSTNNSYYVLPFLWDKEQAEGIHRDIFMEAVKAELMPEENRIDRGIQIGCGYIQPLYKMPLFQTNGHWSIKDKNYSDVYCPVAEKLWKDELFLTLYHSLPLTKKDISDVCEAFIKVWENREELKHD